MATDQPYQFYATLGVGRSASAAEIKSAYIALARRNHPDAHPGDAAAENRFKDISTAYDTLGDAQKRHEYDAAGGMTVFQQKEAMRTHAAREQSRPTSPFGGSPFGGSPFQPGSVDPLGDLLRDLLGDVMRQREQAWNPPPPRPYVRPTHDFSTRAQPRARQSPRSRDPIVDAETLAKRRHQQRIRHMDRAVQAVGKTQDAIARNYEKELRTYVDAFLEEMRAQLPNDFSYIYRTEQIKDLIPFSNLKDTERLVVRLKEQVESARDIRASVPGKLGESDQNLRTLAGRTWEQIFDEMMEERREIYDIVLREAFLYHKNSPGSSLGLGIVDSVSRFCETANELQKNIDRLVDVNAREFGQYCADDLRAGKPIDPAKAAEYEKHFAQEVQPYLDEIRLAGKALQLTLRGQLDDKEVHRALRSLLGDEQYRRFGETWKEAVTTVENVQERIRPAMVAAIDRVIQDLQPSRGH